MAVLYGLLGPPDILLWGPRGRLRPMPIRRRCAALVVVCLLLSGGAAHAQVELAPVLSNVPSPTFATHAGDGSNRLFIVELRGVIDVLQPGASSATTFLDVRGRVLSGGERGLLGLAFHPLYETNGRLFVFYTRQNDGALVIAEYGVSSDRNVASTNERVLLTIPHPGQSNHNGGMLAFGPGGYLHIGVGDGGSSNDPPNNAQNIEALLGKTLRIDVDRPDNAAGLLYSSPSGNPFVGRAGRDEIFAFGLRNPWRFSFDRSTDQQWIGDVGQNAREEVNTPVIPGANFGWRVYEGASCTGNDGGLCRPGDFTAPLFDYTHTNGRCSITGGYVYRGSRGTLANGSYVYGDYCSGEIFIWDGRQQSLLLDTSRSISSFGEDEAGEIYVVGAGGTIERLRNPNASACGVTAAGPEDPFPAAVSTGTIQVTAAPGCAWTVVSNAPWLTVSSPASGVGNGTVTFTLSRYLSRGRFRTASVVIGGAVVGITQMYGVPR